MVELENVLPRDIEKRSFEIISEELLNLGYDEKSWGEDRALIIKRAIHTSADFDYAKNLIFSDFAIESAKEALKNKCVIVTDTQMGKSGINKKKLSTLGAIVECFMSDEDVADAAARNNTTRAVASMEKAARLYGDRPLIFAIGNAPTALIKLYELIQEGLIKPSLVIGVPVGFVNVVQAKELIMTSSVPYIVAKGRKGGSNIVAAIVNGIVYQM